MGEGVGEGVGEGLGKGRGRVGERGIGRGGGRGRGRGQGTSPMFMLLLRLVASWDLKDGFAHWVGPLVQVKTYLLILKFLRIVPNSQRPIFLF